MTEEEGEDEEAQSIRLEAAKKERQALEEARELIEDGVGTLPIPPAFDEGVARYA